jgi:hypothetical protein
MILYHLHRLKSRKILSIERFGKSYFKLIIPELVLKFYLLAINYKKQEIHPPHALYHLL